MTAISSTALARSSIRVRKGHDRWMRAAGWLTVAVLLALWELWGRTTTSSSVASFSASFDAMIDLLTGPALLDDVIPSIGRIFAGYAVAAGAGVGLGLLFGMLPALERWVHPLLEFARAVPPPLIIPIALVVIGLGSELVIAVIAFGAFWPALLNTIDGTRRVEPVFMDTARALHLGPVSRLVKVVIPAALPTIMAGLRVALSVSLILMVLAEMLAASTGIGFQLLWAQQTFDVPTTYGGVLLLAILGWLFDTVFVQVERRVLGWHPAFQGGTNV